uniref:Uncharacterized protein n=1 Tax=Anas zonorhyncha TaxID=75864 RepID=A0A8B9VB17_9AVES
MARGFKQSVKKSLEIYTYLNSFNLVSPFTRSAIRCNTWQHSEASTSQLSLPLLPQTPSLNPSALFNKVCYMEKKNPSKPPLLSLFPPSYGSFRLPAPTPPCVYAPASQFWQ